MLSPILSVSWRPDRNQAVVRHVGRDPLETGAMPSITIDDLPDDPCRRLKAAADEHGHTLADEVVHCLEIALGHRPEDPAERLERIRRIRARIPPEAASPEALGDAIDDGRP